MNNTKNILLMAYIISLLIMGTAIIPVQSYADEHKKTGDLKSSVKTSTDVDKKSSSQKLDQGNTCYRGEKCQQANQGQQITGKDNEANGFNDQSLNIPQPATATPTQPPTQPPTATTATLNICKTVVNSATTSFQPSDFTFTFATLANPNTFQGNNEGCTAVTVAPGTFTFTEFFPPSVAGSGVQTSGGCGVTSEGGGPGTIIGGTISAGETQTCSIINTILQVTLP